MKIGIFITARLGSTRLKKKHLLPVNGHPILHFLIERVAEEFQTELIDGKVNIIIATSDERENRELERFAKDKAAVFYGSINNIPLRHLQAAKAHSLDAIVSIDGDDILCSVKGIRAVYNALLHGASYVKTSNLPFGMNSSGYSKGFLESSLKGHFGDILETGWGRIFNQAQLADIHIPFPVYDNALRFTLDYDEDYQFFKAVIEAFGDDIVTAQDEEIVKFVIDKELYRITEPIAKKYWENFHKIQEKEKQGMKEMMKGPALWNKAKTLIPGGNQLLSKRAEKFLPDLWPAYYSKAKGCEVWDMDGNHYYDFAQMGVGSCILGYADEDVNAAVIEAIQKGAMCSLSCYEEVELAERLIDLHPWADMARFARTGGEACAVAVRIARAASGKSRVAFCGYHGWHDWYLSANIGDASNLDGQLLPGLDPLGVPRELKDTALPFNYNKLNELEVLVDKYPDEIGVIIMEPRREQGPAPGFLEGIREIADRIGAVLIFDEVTSGFRINLGGIHLTYGIEPDIAVFGKAFGNGFPISAVIGRRNIMDCAQNSFISSTMWTERIGFVAALATIKKMEENNVPEFLVRYGERINDGWRKLAQKHDLRVHINGIPPLTHISFEAENPLAVQTLYTQEMLKKGYLLGAAVYATYAYSDHIIDQFIADSDSVFGLIKEALESGDTKKYLKGDVIHSGFRRLT